jgi:hypothetical protein
MITIPPLRTNWGIAKAILSSTFDLQLRYGFGMNGVTILDERPNQISIGWPLVFSAGAIIDDRENAETAA